MNHWGIGGLIVKINRSPLVKMSVTHLQTKRFNLTFSHYMDL